MNRILPQYTVKKRYLIYMAVILVAVYVLLPKIGSLQQTLPLVRHSNPLLVAAAFGSAALSYVGAAGVYYFLAIKHLRYGRTFFMQIAGMFANRLLPAGIGGLGINYLYLRKSRHSAVQATTVLAASNTIGLLGHLLLSFSLLVLLPVRLPARSFGISNKTEIIIVTVGVVLALLAITFPAARLKLTTSVGQVLKQLAHYRSRPRSLILALGCSLSLTAANIVCLWLSILALHLSIGIVPVLLVFTFGLLIGTATPTPGSLGGIEAGLVAGLISYNIPLASAIAATLLYRLVSYWLPLFIGSFAFVIARRRRYF